MTESGKEYKLPRSRALGKMHQDLWIIFLNHNSTAKIRVVLMFLKLCWLVFKMIPNALPPTPQAHITRGFVEWFHLCPVSGTVSVATHKEVIICDLRLGHKRCWLLLCCLSWGLFLKEATVYPQRHAGDWGNPVNNQQGMKTGQNTYGL